MVIQSEMEFLTPKERERGVGYQPTPSLPPPGKEASVEEQKYIFLVCVVRCWYKEGEAIVLTVVFVQIFCLARLTCF